MKPNIYIGGEKVGRTDERFQGGARIIKESYDRAHDPRYADVCTTTSHLTGEKINRFTHVHRSVDDLLTKQEMTRLLCHLCGGCIQRCMGIDAINALDVVTYEVDQATGSDYHRRLENYLKYFQNNDLVASGAQTDVKGDRLRRPHEQEDPDMYLRIVESRLDGIVVRGCKNSITNTAYADEIIALPTRFMSERDSDYAVAFALPSDWDGMRLWQGLLTPTAASS